MRNGWILSLVTFAATAPALAWAQAVEQAAPVAQLAETAQEVHQEGGSSMPQLDPTYFASQLFWLLVSGVLLYVLMSKWALPRVARAIDQRDEQVRKDLEKAARLKLEAEDIKLLYLRALRDADERARAQIERTISDMREKQTTALENLHIRTQQQIVDTEKSLRAQKEEVLTEVSTISNKLSNTIIQQLSKKAA